MLNGNRIVADDFCSSVVKNVSSVFSNLASLKSTCLIATAPVCVVTWGNTVLASNLRSFDIIYPSSALSFETLWMIKANGASYISQLAELNSRDL